MTNLQFRVVDSHTAGEPTRTIVSGGPAPHGENVNEWLQSISKDFDQFRTAIILEPRGSEVMVGAHLLPPANPKNTAAVIFFNNVGYLGMCGHGLIGVVETLRYLQRISPGTHVFETVAGLVEAELFDDYSVQLKNVPSFRTVTQLPLVTPNFGVVHADIAYGGNWFCLVKHPMMNEKNPSKPQLLQLANEILEQCRRTYPEVDHVELFGPPFTPNGNARNFVLCPGAMYDRSPCGTGTSAKLACLAATRELQQGQSWIQEGILGTSFEGSFEWLDPTQGIITPFVRGRAFVNGDLNVVIDPNDPFAWGL
jgi:4-hydroxyproline epimerase